MLECREVQLAGLQHLSLCAFQMRSCRSIVEERQLVPLVESEALDLSKVVYGFRELCYYKNMVTEGAKTLSKTKFTQGGGGKSRIMS